MATDTKHTTAEPRKGASPDEKTAPKTKEPRLPSHKGSMFTYPKTEVS